MCAGGRGEYQGNLTNSIDALVQERRKGGILGKLKEKNTSSRDLVVRGECERTWGDFREKYWEKYWKLEV